MSRIAGKQSPEPSRCNNRKCGDAEDECEGEASERNLGMGAREGDARVVVLHLVDKLVSLLVGVRLFRQHALTSHVAHFQAGRDDNCEAKCASTRCQGADSGSAHGCADVLDQQRTHMRR